MGGESNRQVAAHAEVEAYDPKTGRWTALPPSPSAGTGCRLSMVGDRVHVVAGSGNRGGGPELNDHWVLSGL